MPHSWEMNTTTKDHTAINNKIAIVKTVKRFRILITIFFKAVMVSLKLSETNRYVPTSIGTLPI